MDKQRRNKVIIGVFIVFSFIVGWAFGHYEASFNQVGFTPTIYNRDLTKSNADFSLFWRSWDLLVEKFDGEVDYEKMIYGAIKGMTEALGDPYTAFLTPDEAKVLSNELSGVIYGIGAEVGIKNDNLTIITPLEGTPASKSGLLAGDIILKINDESTKDMTLDLAVSKIRGNKGTKVKLTIQRGEKIKDFEIIRDKITVKSVEEEIKEGDIGYVRIRRFDENTTSLLKESLNNFISRDIKKIIIDLRGNPGGYFDQSIEVASQFIEEGVIVSEKNDSKNENKRDYKATGGGKATSDSFKIAVLIDEGSASAAEIVAGALKDHKKATLIGKRTFGKGSVQELENLAKGAMMRITISHWYTPSGKNISKEGIEPDIEVDLTEEDYNNNRDPQLQKAIEFLKSI